jgi:hypothetical protein
LAELAGTLLPPISRPRSRTSAFLASGMAISVLKVNATAFNGVRAGQYLVGPGVAGAKGIVGIGGLTMSVDVDPH